MNKQGKTHHMPSIFPPTELGYSQFEPSDISIPTNMGVVWFNDDDSEHSVTFNDTSPEAIDPGTIAPGGFFIHQFSTPGIYEVPMMIKTPQQRGGST